MTDPLQSIWRHEARLRPYLPEGFDYSDEGQCFTLPFGFPSKDWGLKDDAALIILCYAAERALEAMGYVVMPEQRGRPDLGYVLREIGTFTVIGPSWLTREEVITAALEAITKEPS